MRFTGERDMAARRQSAVEVAGGYVLDYIRSKREERAAAVRVEDAAAELEAAHDHLRNTSDLRSTASARLDAYVQAAIDAE